MEYGFSLAGSTIAERQQRARTVRPSEEDAHRLPEPVSKELSGDLVGGIDEEDDGMFYPDHLDEDLDGGGTRDSRTTQSEVPTVEGQS